LSLAVFYYTKRRFIPQIEKGYWRWSYDVVVHGDVPKVIGRARKPSSVTYPPSPLWTNDLEAGVPMINLPLVQPSEDEIITTTTTTPTSPGVSSKRMFYHNGDVTTDDDDEEEEYEDEKEENSLSDASDRTIVVDKV